MFCPVNVHPYPLNGLETFRLVLSYMFRLGELHRRVLCIVRVHLSVYSRLRVRTQREPMTS